MEKLTLLQVAKQGPNVSKISKRISDEEIELALAYLKDEVSYSQIQAVLKMKNGGGVYNFITTRVREAFRRNLITIK